MEIKLPEIIDVKKEIIKTSDNHYESLLTSGKQLHLLSVQTGNALTDICVEHIRILSTNDGKNILVKVDANVGCDYKANPRLYDLTGLYIFVVAHNMFKFGSQWQPLWADYKDKEWILP